MGAETSRYTTDEVRAWSPDTVAAKLNEIGEAFGGYGQAIRANGIDGEMLLMLRRDHSSGPRGKPEPLG